MNYDVEFDHKHYSEILAENKVRVERNPDHEKHIMDRWSIFWPHGCWDLIPGEWSYELAEVAAAAFAFLWLKKVNPPDASMFAYLYAAYLKEQEDKGQLK
jgi:hypothetical protein